MSERQFIITNPREVGGLNNEEIVAATRISLGCARSHCPGFLQVEQRGRKEIEMVCHGDFPAASWPVCGFRQEVFVKRQKK